MSRIVLVRHGETVWHAENRYAGRTDIALTPKGHAQAEKVGAWAAGAGLTGIWTSTLSRAQVTATPASEATGLPLQIDARLVEVDFGRGEGLTDAEMQEQFPEDRRLFKLDPAKHFLPGGEDPKDVAARGVEVLQEIGAKTGDGRALVVAHNTFIRITLCRLLGIEIARYRSVFPKLANGTLTEIDLTPGNAALLSFNAPLA